MCGLQLAFYISGHGFGHASRQIAIVNALHRRRPDISFLLRTEVPRRLLDRTLTPPFDLDAGPCDTGIVQIDALRLDARATIAKARDFYGRGFDARVDAEADRLRAHGIRLVIADAPPLACAAAARVGIPAIVVANFTWDWIYEDYREHLGSAPDLLPTIREAYAGAREAWRLPMHGGFETFDRIRDTPFVARHARHARGETRGRLELPMDARLVLCSFGGYDVEGIDFAALDTRGDWHVVSTTNDSSAASVGRVLTVRESRIYDEALRYEDLVCACDVVVSKPGYGIISECIANGTALVYTDRDRFAEYPVLVSEMPNFVRCAYLDQASLRAGRWQSALDAAVGAPRPSERPATDGADVIADMMSALCSHDAAFFGLPPQL